MTTLTLTSGQISPIIEIGKGTRVTSSGNGTIEYYPGSLANAKNGGTFEAWPKGTSAGSADAIRSMCIRATATGAMTVTLEEGKNDLSADGAYWDSEYATFSTDANGNTVLLGADGARITKLGISQVSRVPSPAVGTPLALADVTGSTGCTITLETGPNGNPALKVVTTSTGGTAHVRFPGLVDASHYGDAFVVMHGSYTQGNLDYLSFNFSQDDASYAKSGVTLIQYGYPAPLNSNFEQGGANTYFFAKPKIVGTGTPTYPAKLGECRLSLTARSGTIGTFYIYAAGLSAPSKKARICVTWDDGYDSFFKLGYEAFASRGIKQTLSVIGSAIGTGGTYASLRQLQAFVSAGNACVAHGPFPAQGAGNLFTAYPSSTNPVADAVNDMKQNRQYLIDNDLLVANAASCYVWPQGTFQQSVNDTTLLDAAIAAGFKLGRGTSPVATSVNYPGGVRADAASKYNRLALPILGHSWGGTTAAEATNISNITTAITNMSTYRGDAFLMFHRVQPTSTADGSMSSIGIRVGDLETIAAAIKTEIDAGTMEAVTMPEMVSDTEWNRH